MESDPRLCWEVMFFNMEPSSCDSQREKFSSGGASMKTMLFLLDEWKDCLFFIECTFSPRSLAEIDYKLAHGHAKLS